MVMTRPSAWLTRSRKPLGRAVILLMEKTSFYIERVHAPTTTKHRKKKRRQRKKNRAINHHQKTKRS
jgi:hypothetical protein